MTDPKDFLQSIETIARESGAILLKHFRNLSKIDKKGSRDLVTIADRESEEYIAGEILRRYPDHAVLGEEGGKRGNPDSAYLWIVDPLDGTTNFTHGLRIFTNSIAITRDGKPLAGAIYAPALDEMYITARGCGASRNGEPIHVSETTELGESLIVTGFPYDTEKQVEILKGMLGQVLLNCRGVLRLGSAAYDYCLVASGNLEAFYEYGLNPWDMAAGVLMVEEAGGKLSGMLAGEEFDLFARRSVASNGKIHDQLLTALASGGVADFDKL